MAKRKTRIELARELGDEFRINQNLNEVFDEAAAARLGVNATGLRCLDIIQRLGRVTAGELAREAGLTTGAVTSVVDRLVGLGYAQREADPQDRRKVLISLTPAALEAVYEIWGPRPPSTSSTCSACRARASSRCSSSCASPTTSSAARSSGSRTSPVERVAQAATSVETTAS